MATTFNLSSISGVSAGTHAITAKAVKQGFITSPSSNSVNWTKSAYDYTQSGSELTIRNAPYTQSGSEVTIQ